MDRNWTVGAEPAVTIPAELGQLPTVLANVAQQQVLATASPNQLDESDGTLGRLPDALPEEHVSAPPSLSAALNPTDVASAVAAMPVFPNIDLAVLEETQANMDITKFVILSQARSGSTWLASMLNSHPNVLAFGEYLSSWAGHNVDGDGLVCKPQERLAKLDNINNWKQCSEWNFSDKQKWLEAAKAGPVATGLCVHTCPTGSTHKPQHTHDLVAPCC